MHATETLLDFDAARGQMLAAARRVKGRDRIALIDAEGRILAEPIVSAIAVPPLDNSGMDGYAVRCADLAEHDTRLPIAQRIPAGSIGRELAPGTAARIFTGAPVPPGADAVVMQERCTVEGGTVTIHHRPQPGAHIRRAGEDIVTGTEVLPAHTLLSPQAIGLAASIGLAALPVYRRLSVGLLSTGDELVEPGQPLPPGCIHSSNRPMIAALLKRLGCTVEDMGNVGDNFQATRRALLKAGNLHDLVITTGGVSVGEEDHVRQAVANLGEIKLWRLAIQPGKPMAFGKAGDADFIGLPGNPVAAFVSFVLLARPFIRVCQGAAAPTPNTLLLPAAFDRSNRGPLRQFLRARRDEEGRVALYPNQSTGVLTSTVWADGLADIAAGQEIRTGEPVRFIPMTELI